MAPPTVKLSVQWGALPWKLGSTLTPFIVEGNKDGVLQPTTTHNPLLKNILACTGKN